MKHAEQHNPETVITNSPAQGLALNYIANSRGRSLAQAKNLPMLPTISIFAKTEDKVMMQKLIMQEIQLLPEFAQIEVLNYLLFLKSKYQGKMNVDENSATRPTFGCGSVKITMSEDFDELLKDFKEYMQ